MRFLHMPEATRPIVWVAAIAVVVLGAFSFAQSPARDPFAPLPADQQIDLADRDRVERIANSVVDRRFDILEEILLSRVEQRVIDRSETLRIDLADEVLRLEAAVFGDVGLAEEEGGTLLQRLATLEARLQMLTSEMSLGPDGALMMPGADTGAMSLSDLDAAEATFIACVNGQPLFRAANGSTFYAEEIQLAPGRQLCGS